MARRRGIERPSEPYTGIHARERCVACDSIDWVTPTREIRGWLVISGFMPLPGVEIEAFCWTCGAFITNQQG